MVKSLPVTLQVGKNGVTDPFIQEVSGVLRKNGTVKIKLLKTADISVSEASNIFSSRLSARVESLVGRVIVLSRKKHL